MTQDPYEGFAERYDWMKQENPARQEFFRSLFGKHGVQTVLDCACGTGRDLLMFRSMGLDVVGSDLSDSMLAAARRNIAETDIAVRKVDYCELPENYDARFDAVICLSNSINEPLEDAETLRALRSMKAVLRTGGILVFDQGQTDASMRNPPAFAPILNNRDFTRFFTMKYAGDIQTVNIFDFVHTEGTSDFKHSSVRIRIRLQESWNEILREAGFQEIACFGDWDSTAYDRNSSRRLIVVAKK
ncbi:MAG: methyltransferase domain-containing protein [Kiritimatiellae bacterium]|nr:methyltransferase domain-containing protein [Kiritimatiellia bacterium]